MDYLANDTAHCVHAGPSGWKLHAYCVWGAISQLNIKGFGQVSNRSEWLMTPPLFTTHDVYFHAYLNLCMLYLIYRSVWLENLKLNFHSVFIRHHTRDEGDDSIWWLASHWFLAASLIRSISQKPAVFYFVYSFEGILYIQRALLLPGLSGPPISPTA